LYRKRNNCLKEDKIDFLYLDVVTNELISLNKKIMEIRRKYIEILNNTLKNNKLFSNEEYSIIYKPNLDEDNIKNLFIKKQNFDILNKITNLGIHKDDFEIIINNIKAEDFASYGQMRSIIINLKIAVLEVIKEYKKILPVLLLDDIFVGLDDNRKNILIQKIKGMQVFITTNSLENIDKKLLENSNIIKLEREE
jgi:DNA replication and repair protein RecF